MPLLNRPDATLILGTFGLFLLTNLITFLAFRCDKHRAVNALWRIPESSLLFWALIGGWFGAKLAQKRYRHKTRKEPFRSILNAIPFVWAAMATAIWFELWQFL